MIVALILLLIAIPIGYTIAWISHDELVDGRKYFRLIIILSIIIGIWNVNAGNEAVAWTLGSLIVISKIGLLKSYDERWTGRERE